ncbi:MAG: tetratricopeptide (TPR) repeat protein, partial [Planctomycetota bacterium]
MAKRREVRGESKEVAARIERHLSRLSLKKSLLIALAASAALLYWAWPPNHESSRLPSTTNAHAQFVGSESCKSCHAEEHKDWMGSHHERSMQPATAENVLGVFDGRTLTHDGITSRFFKKDEKFFVNTQGADGNYADFEVGYTFGWQPLQQYLVRFPDGKIQTLRTSWDTRPKSEGGQRWYHVYPDEHIPPGDQLHWMGQQQNWNFMCAECHNTGFEKNYDAPTRTFDSTWEEINVSCEACHGPGADHLTWTESKDDSPHHGFTSDLVAGMTKWNWDPKTKKPVRVTESVTTTEVETCARCHSRRSQLWSDVRHGDMLSQTHRVAILSDLLYFPDGQIKDEVFVYGSFVQSKMHKAGVRCTDCHLPHKTGMRFEGNLLCVRCHGDADYEVMEHMHHQSGTPGGNCVDCHMPERTYMVVDPRRDHRFGSPRPDVSKSIGTPNACSTCHQDKDISWTLTAFEKWYGTTRKSQIDHGILFALGRAQDPRATPGLLSLSSDPETAAITRATALDLLSRVPSQQTIQVFVQSLFDDEPMVRRQALEGLDSLNPANRLQVVGPLLKDKVRLVRMEAARSLANIARTDFPSDLIDAYDQALGEFIAAQKANADRDFGQYNLGLLYSRLGRSPEARMAYREALFLNPSYLRAWVNLADAFREEGNEDGVMATLAEAEKTIGPQGVLQHALGLSLVRQKKSSEAIKAFETAAQLEPQNPNRCSTLVAAFLSIDDKESAYAAYDKFLAKNPKHPGILQGAIQIHMEHGNKKRALPYAKRLLELFPN